MQLASTGTYAMHPSTAMRLELSGCIAIAIPSGYQAASFWIRWVGHVVPAPGVRVGGYRERAPGMNDLMDSI